MEFERVLGFVALGWLIGGVLLTARLIRKGRRLTETLAAQHPATYQTLGRPQPGFLQSPRRNRFSQFLARREYEDLNDPALSARFEDYRKAEARLLLSLLASLGVIALLVLTVRYVG